MDSHNTQNFKVLLKNEIKIIAELLTAKLLKTQRYGVLEDVLKILKRFFKKQKSCKNFKIFLNLNPKL